MKKLIMAILVSLPVSAVEIESEFEKYSNLNEAQANLLAIAVNRAGYSCYSVSSAMIKAHDEFRLVCNEFTYTYIIRDVGGRIVVEVD